MLLELERECLEIYRRKVDEAANEKTRLHQCIAAKEAEVCMLMAALGEIYMNSPCCPGLCCRMSVFIVNYSWSSQKKKSKPLKLQLDSVTPIVEDLKLKKEERTKQFADIKAQIEKITSEISGYGQLVGVTISLDLEEQDLSLRKFTEHQSRLRALQKDKSERLQKVMDYVNEAHTLSSVLGLDFSKTLSDVHPSLRESSLEHATNISDSTLEGLDQAVLRLKTERKFRYQKLKDVAGSLFELWKLMDTKHEEKVYFLKITSILNLSESEIVQAGGLAMEIVEQASAEVERLSKLKTSRLKELVLKKRSELEDICRKVHIQPDASTAADKTNALIDSGLVDPSEILTNIETQISNAKDEALTRKEIMDKIDRWLSACDEENWLDDYNRDENRYSAGRAMVENLIRHTLSWEDEKHKHFLYDGVGFPNFVRLVSILEDYKLTRIRKEEEKKRARDHKKLQNLLLTEKEAMYGSKPSPRRSNSFRTTNGYQAYGNGSVTPSPRRNSVGCATPEVHTPRSYSGRPNGYFKEMRRLSTAPLNFVAIPKEDTLSFSSVYGSEPESPQS
ncbi:65-kDa microtubule-associated protein 6-like [Dorcoceras hygrometricum]|uniref:65-kDa microtubule-associated protein 6-like n=1 Tax=Dorcoceras hygrometricum TaxID=472368 RepID=A0A2Z7CHD0_9LAMI|nr:65-kDa microtubule-associated protein 6-like [Dorcoceras hygrometricum]